VLSFKNLTSKSSQISRQNFEKWMQTMAEFGQKRCKNLLGEIQNFINFDVKILPNLTPKFCRIWPNLEKNSHRGRTLSTQHIIKDCFVSKQVTLEH
jgi:hypothetical protein